jgi:hypothetical protein
MTTTSEAPARRARWRRKAGRPAPDDDNVMMLDRGAVDNRDSR